MNSLPEKAVFYHFRFKFLAITSIAFLIYIILTGAAELKDFASSVQFKLMGPFFLLAGMSFLFFRKFPFKCPHCFKINLTRKNWICCECGQAQGKERYLNDKCLHCGQMQTTSSCDHCSKLFRL